VLVVTTKYGRDISPELCSNITHSMVVHNLLLCGTVQSLGNDKCSGTLHTNA